MIASKIICVGPGSPSGEGTEQDTESAAPTTR
jgi:hypothetical protein